MGSNVCQIFCQSLGNQFCIFDGANKPKSSWPTLTKKLCHEHKLDGILVCDHKKSLDITIFNADGSNGQLCLNGARCVASYLYSQHRYPKKFELTMGKKTIVHTVEFDGKRISITQQIPLGVFLGKKTIILHNNNFAGYVVDVGNPHFIIFEKKDRVWLEQYGHLIEQHDQFPHKTNVEFVWPDKTKPDAYHTLVYERGCGITQACSSGAAAITQLLYEKKRIHLSEPVKICMQGGALTCWLTPTKQIALRVIDELDSMVKAPSTVQF